MPKPADLTSPNPTDVEGAENQEGNEQAQQEAQPQIDWESEGNPYRKRYADSQGQIQPLVRTLQQLAEFDHTSKTWKPKTSTPETIQQDPDFEKMLDGYDPEFKKAMVGYTQKQIKDAINAFRKESAFEGEYTAGVQSSRSKAMGEFGDEFEFVKNGKMNPLSPLYKLADEIVQNKYAQFNPDGTFAKYSNQDAEYLATVEAYAILSKRSKQQAQDKGKLGAIQGKGTRASGVKGELTYEEYNKLSEEAKNSYDAHEKGGV